MELKCKKMKCSQMLVEKILLYIGSPMCSLRLVQTEYTRGNLIEVCGLGGGSHGIGLKCHVLTVFWTQRFL